MAERKAQQKYFPPDYNPDKPRRGLNRGLGEAPDPETAGYKTLRVRFELPFDAWCFGCERLIAQGVRFNSQKKRIGSYYSTPIYSFSFKCHLCPNIIEIHTDPQNAKYVIADGARAKIKEYDPEDIGLVSIEKKDHSSLFAQVEHQAKDEAKAQESKTLLTRLYHRNESSFKDPYSIHKVLRGKLRSEVPLASEPKNTLKASLKRLAADDIFKPSKSNDPKNLVRQNLIHSKQDKSHVQLVHSKVEHSSNSNNSNNLHFDYTSD